MLDNPNHHESRKPGPGGGALEWNLSRRGLFGAAALLGLAATARPAERAFAWSSWTNMTSGMLKNIGMGDCVHEDLVQISYARVVQKHKNEPTPYTLLNPWAGMLLGDRKYAQVGDDVVYAGKDGKPFESLDDLAARLYRENLAYLRIGSYWNDAAANTTVDFGLSCARPNAIPKFSGGRYEGAWDVGTHIRETADANKSSLTGKSLDALVQFTMNDRNNFIHGMLTSQADLSTHLSFTEIKQYALQWLGVAYEYARTGEVKATSDVTKEQAQKIFDGFIDTYGQLADKNDDKLSDDEKFGMCVSLQVSSSEASIRLPKRRLRLRALGMMCHTMEDFWCPAHTCRTYHEGGNVPKHSILAFSNYKWQNGNKMPMNGYHIPFDRYAVADMKKSTNWREALTRGSDGYKGTETLANVLAFPERVLADAHTYFSTLGMNETIACITQLLDYLYTDTPWDGDGGVRKWVDEQVMPVYYFEPADRSYVCDAGRRGLHTPTYIIAPITAAKRAFRKAELTDAYDKALKAAKAYDAWQRGAHRFFSGKYNTNQAKRVTIEDDKEAIWTDETGEKHLIALVDALYQANGNKDLAAKLGFNGCHALQTALGMVSGMLQEFNIDLRGSLRPNSDEIMKKALDLQIFFESGAASQIQAQSESAPGLFVADAAEGDKSDGDYETSNMTLEDFEEFEDGSCLIAVRDMDSLETSIMAVPEHTPGKDKLRAGASNLRITYVLQTEFEGDPDFIYVVSKIEDSGMAESVYLVSGTVKSVSAAKKRILLDLNGISEFELNIVDGVDVPQVGDYICARYSFDDAGANFVGYDELEEPGEQKKVTYLVAKAVGSRLWLLDADSVSEDGSGYSDYLQIEYRSANVLSIPQEGYMAMVIYHDEAYGDVTDVDEAALASAWAAASFPSVTAQEGEEGATGGGDMYDSADTPGYLALGDEYEQLNYGNEVIHVADAIMGLPTRADDDEIYDMYGGYYDGKTSVAGETEYRYFSNGDGTHRKYSDDPSQFTEENCTYDSKGVCTLCKYAKPSGTKPGQGSKRAKQDIRVDTAKKRMKAARLKKKARFTSKVKVKGAKTKVTYKRLKKGSSAKLAINPKTGKIKVKRGTPKGTYRIRIKVSAAMTTAYEAAAKVVTIVVEVI